MPVLLPGMTAATKPKVKDTVLLYWRSPLGDKIQKLFTTPQHPRHRRPGLLGARSPLQGLRPLGRVHWRLVSVALPNCLPGMCADKTLDATFVVERTPDLIVNPTDQALSIRPEGPTHPAPADNPKPPSDGGRVPDVGRRGACCRNIRVVVGMLGAARQNAA